MPTLVKPTISLPDFPFNNWRNLEGLVFYTPLWHEKLNKTPFPSQDFYHHSCTVVGATWGSQGRTFDGTDDKISIEGSNPLDIVSALTIEAWIKVTDVADYRMVVGKTVTNDGNDDPYHFRVDITTGLLFGRVGNGTTSLTITGGTAVGTGWRHSAFTHTGNGGSMSLYLDGVSDATPVSLTLTPITNAATLTVGTWAVYWFKGLIGEVWIYNRALSALEIQHNYLATRWRYV